MRNIIIVTLTLFAVALGACSNPALTMEGSQLSVCEPDQVDNMIIHVGQGSAKLVLTKVQYMDLGTLRDHPTYVELKVSIDDTVEVPYCRMPGTGEVRFQFEITPSGPGVLYGYEYSVEITYESPDAHLGLRVWDENNFENPPNGMISESVSVSTHTNGETDNYTVALKAYQM